MAKILGTGLLLLLLLGASGYGYAISSGPLVDPMRPIHYQEQAVGNRVEKKAQVDTQNWKLLAVLTSAGRSVAIINGKTLQIGDRLEGYKLVKIAFDRVVLRNKQATLVLHRAGTGLKKISVDKEIGKGSKP